MKKDIVGWVAISMLVVAFLWLLFTNGEEEDPCEEALENMTREIEAIWELITEDSVVCFGDSIIPRPPRFWSSSPACKAPNI